MDARAAQRVKMHAIADQPAQHLALISLLAEKGILGEKEIKDYNERAILVRDKLAEVMERMGMLLGLEGVDRGAAKKAGYDIDAEIAEARRALSELEHAVLGTYFTAELREGIEHAVMVVEQVSAAGTGVPSLEIYLDLIVGTEKVQAQRPLVVPVNRDLATRIITTFLSAGGTDEVLQKEVGGVRQLLEDFNAWSREQS